MTPINHYEGDRPEDFYQDGLFVRFAIKDSEIPEWCPLRTVANGYMVVFTKIDRYIAYFVMPYSPSTVGVCEYCYKELRRTLIDTIGKTILTELTT